MTKESDKIDRIAEHFVNRVFEQHGLTAGNGEPAIHEADPCTACGFPMWRSTSPNKESNSSPSVRVPLYRDRPDTAFCQDCLAIKDRYPEVFAFIVKNANWLAVRVDVEKKLHGDGKLYHYRDAPADDESDFPE